jgi:hypothetical protein
MQAFGKPQVDCAARQLQHPAVSNPVLICAKEVLVAIVPLSQAFLKFKTQKTRSLLAVHRHPLPR